MNAVAARHRPPAAGAMLCLPVAWLAACSGSGPATAGTSAPPAGPTEAATTGGRLSSSPTANPPVATAPATFQLTVSGDSNVNGTWSPSFGISCDNPTFGGPDIIFFAQSPDTKAVVLVTLKTGSIEVSERAGQGATYTDREFQGSGVSSFDPARGGTFDSDLSVAPNPGGNPGTLGSIGHVSGSVDCGDQTAGSSTVVASGVAPDGPLSGPFTAFRVQCNSSAQFGNGVSVTAIITAGTNPQLLIIALPSNLKATIFSIGQSPATNHSFAIDPAGTLQISATGAHLDADFVEALAAGSSATPDRIHLAGDATCGTTVHS